MAEKNNNKPGQETAPDNNILNFQMDLNPEETTSDEMMTGQVETNEAQERAKPIKPKISLDDKSFDKLLKDWRESREEFNQLNEESRKESTLRESKPTKGKIIITNLKQEKDSNIKRIQSDWKDQQELQSKEKRDKQKQTNEEPANNPKSHQTKTLNISSQKGIRDFRLNKK